MVDNEPGASYTSGSSPVRTGTGTGTRSVLRDFLRLKRTSTTPDAVTTMSPAGCPHVNNFKVDNWKQNLRVIYQCFVWSGSAETRKRKVTSDGEPGGD